MVDVSDSRRMCQSASTAGAMLGPRLMHSGTGRWASAVTDYRVKSPRKSRLPSPNTVHFEILIAAVKSIRTVGSGVRGRSG